MTGAQGASLQLAEQTERVKGWAERAHSAGWLASDQLGAVDALSGATSADLFAEGTGEPLVVALFGGTGVGKSSLLNRLVGTPVAKVGVIRPTSLEATVYVHRDVDFAGPAQEGFARATHEDDARRHVVWVDMPDVDSTAIHNRELVLGFLPYVDVLVYVVSPERYRDEAPWALLAEHADRCAWVFVMNQIDRGQQAQLDDLQRAVTAAGFDDPLVFATRCGQATEPVPLDSFTELAAFIDSLAAERLRDALHQEGRLARLRLLADQVEVLSAHWPAKSSGLARVWEASRTALHSELREDLIERLAAVAARMADGEAAAPGELWGAWASDRVSDALAATKLEAREQGWVKAATAGFDTVVDDSLGARCEEHLRASVAQSLARPGNALQRGLHAACGKLTYALPLICLLWIGWFVVQGFMAGATGAGEFVASGFAMNAVLLLALSAGLPWLLQRLVEPSPRKAAMLGVRQGLDAVIEHIDQRVQTSITQATDKLDALRIEREQLLAADGAELPAGDALTRRLRRG